MSELPLPTDTHSLEYKGESSDQSTTRRALRKLKERLSVIKASVGQLTGEAVKPNGSDLTGGYVVLVSPSVQPPSSVCSICRMPTCFFNHVLASDPQCVHKYRLCVKARHPPDRISMTRIERQLYTQVADLEGDYSLCAQRHCQFMYATVNKLNVETQRHLSFLVPQLSWCYALAEWVVTHWPARLSASPTDIVKFKWSDEVLSTDAEQFTLPPKSWSANFLSYTCLQVYLRNGRVLALGQP